MGYKNYKQAAFSVVELLLIIVIVAVVAFIGYRVISNMKKPPATPQTYTTQPKPAISNKEDLTKAADDLKKVDTSTKQDEASLRKLVQ